MSLISASKEGDLTTLSRLLNDGADIETRNKSRRTALHAAAAHGQIETLDFLISNNADIEAEDKDSWSPLHHAANNGHSEGGLWLLEPILKLQLMI